MQLIAAICVLAAVLPHADGRAARRRDAGTGKVASAQFELEEEHTQEDWRAKYLGVSARLENNECGRPDELDDDDGL